MHTTARTAQVPDARPWSEDYNKPDCCQDQLCFGGDA
jgi:hypothetical protein